MGITPKGSCETPLSAVEGERNRNLNREVWESPCVHAGEDVNQQTGSRPIAHSSTTQGLLGSVSPLGLTGDLLQVPT